MSRLDFRPLTPGRWRDLESLFGENGACGGCWCMWWRLKRADWARGKGAKNKAAFRRIVAKRVPGILAYDGPRPVAWCAVEPRERYPVLERSPSLKRVDEEPVWSVTCLFVAKDWRRKGVSSALLRAAAKHVKARRGRIVEGYPVEPRKWAPDPFVWTGLLSAFEKAGFRKVARPRKRPIVRRNV